MTAGRLLAWEATARRRRREARPPLARVAEGGPAAVLAGLAAAGALAWIARAADAGEARGWWAVVTAGAIAGVVLRSPWRLFWRPDAALLARLPIPGRALYALALVRSARAATGVAVALALAAAPVAGDAATWLRCAGVVAAASACAALVAPAAATLAGTLVASSRAQRAFAEMTGEGGAPSVVWLSIVPALAGAGVGAVAWLLVPWALAGAVLAPPAVVAAAGLGAAAAFAAAGGWLAERALSVATREVAALDAVRLAHVDLDRARGLEAVWGRVAAGGAAAAVYRKDVALARRRYPGAYLLAGAIVIALWATAIFADPPGRERWTVGLAAALAAYAALFGRRLARPPVERPRLLATLPIPAPATRRAKAAYAVWRALVPVALGATPAVARAGAPLSLGLACLALALAGAATGAALSRPVPDELGG